MDNFFLLLWKILPLYFVVLLGFCAGRILKIQKQQVARLLIYIISPVVAFNGVLTTPIAFSTLSLPLLYIFIAILICYSGLYLTKTFWQDSSLQTFAFAAATGNTGYFGLPVAIAIFGEQVIGLVILIALGAIIFEVTVGYYVMARGNYDIKESVARLIRLPAIYAFIAGVLLNAWGCQFGDIYTITIKNFQGAYTILGMMTIGLGLSDVSKADFDFKFIFGLVAAKFLVWPVVSLVIIFLDLNYMHIYSQEIHCILFLLSVVPVAANTVAFSSELGTKPEKAAIAVVVTTILAIGFVPLSVGLFLNWYNLLLMNH